MHAFRLDLRQPSALLVRPGETAEAVRARAEADVFAAAAAAAARCHVPVDVALWTCAELVAVGPEADGELCWDIALSAPTGAVDDAGRRQWLRQLRVGCGYVEDTLPVFWAPRRLGITGGDLAAAARLAADAAMLRAVLDAECAASASGQTLTEAAISAQTGRRRAAR